MPPIQESASLNGQFCDSGLVFVLYKPITIMQTREYTWAAWAKVNLQK